MIQNREIRKAEAQDVAFSWSFFGSVENNPACEGCVYYKALCGHHGQKACHFSLEVGHLRHCDPGEGCKERIVE